jgi:alcohol dehydrogenase (NADP+)
VPDGLSSEIAASLYCAGVTVYQPLRSYGAGPGKKVGIVGLGGLGHLGLQFSKALGAETYVLSHSPSKKADADAMGADGFIVTKDIASVAEQYSQFFDIILCTSYQDDMPLNDLYVSGARQSNP